MNSFKNHQKLAKISHYLLARLVVQKLIDNYISIIMLSELVQYQGKARLAFYKLNIQNGISRNTGKCKLDKFLLRQSQTLATIYCMYE